MHEPTDRERFWAEAELRAKLLGEVLGAPEEKALDIGSLAEQVLFWKHSWKTRMNELNRLRASIAHCAACGAAMRVTDAGISPDNAATEGRS